MGQQCALLASNQSKKVIFLPCIRPKKIIVWLSTTTFLECVRAGGQIFFFFFFKSKLHRILASTSPNKDANKSTLQKKSLYTSFKLKCKQVNNNKLKNIFKRSKFSETKKTFFWNSEN